MTKNITSAVVSSISLFSVTTYVVCDLTSSWKRLLYVICVHSETLLYLTKLLLVIYGV